MFHGIVLYGLCGWIYIDFGLTGGMKDCWIQYNNCLLLCISFVLVGMYFLPLSHIKHALNCFNFSLLTEGMRYHSVSQTFINWYIVEFSSSFNHWQLEIDLGSFEIVIFQIVSLTLFKLSSKGLQQHSDLHCTCHAPTWRLPTISECELAPFSHIILVHHLVLSIITQTLFISFIYQFLVPFASPNHAITIDLSSSVKSCIHNYQSCTIVSQQLRWYIALFYFAGT
jgi:hypothetical protein